MSFYTILHHTNTNRSSELVSASVCYSCKMHRKKKKKKDSPTNENFTNGERYC